MPWLWRIEDESGNEVSLPDLAGQEFPAQGDAETWLGEIWRDLVAAGADAVTLLEDDREVYGPMSLHAPGSE
ncbi:MAG: hypothetical protein GEU93_14895 [Propionibacteriales bacterium]|nr:hypothetical protein [Propionibacteriales bacterium]